MTDKSNKFSNDLSVLVTQGDMLHNAMQYECFPEKVESEITKTLKLSPAETKAVIGKFPKFNTEYQKWFSEAQMVVKQLLPNRIDDFNSYYEYPKPRKDITFQNYMIKDNLQGLRITRFSDVIADGSSAIPAFRQRLEILKAAHVLLNSSLLDLKGILQADLYDSEIESAGVLAKAGWLERDHFKLRRSQHL